MMINDFQTIGAYGGFVEINHEGVATTAIEATPTGIMTLKPADGAKVFPYAVRTMVAEDGWIDVRSFSELTIMGWALAQNSNILIQSRKSSIDPTTPVVNLVATTLLTVGTPQTLYSSNTANITHIRILHSAASALGGTTNVSVFMR